jgi:hypothetical protein
MRSFVSKSVLAFCVLGLVAVTAHAQPKPKKKGPPPAPTLPQEAPIGTPAANNDMKTSDQPLLAKETEVRRGFHFEAFIDAELGIINKDYYPTRGFTLNDAAIYLGKDFGRGLTAMVDLPFASVPQSLVPGAATSTTSVAFGAARAQAYAQWVSGPWLAKFGQFDTIYGYEKNHSRDRFFANAGIVKAAIVPGTHLGAMGSYSMQQLTFRAMVADPHDVGTMANQNPEVGVQARFDGTPAYAAAGFSIGDQKNGPGSNQLIDVNAGMHMEKISGGAYFDDRKTSGVDKHATGFGAQGVFESSPDLGIGARLEYATDLDATIKNEFILSAGPSYRWMPDVTVRGDADIASLSPNVGDNVTIFGAQFSLVASF